ncbi:MAG: hypothetical protein LBT30_05060 [Clostridiales bacterium]|nr:hypothetical protein [Clostridiales bacterium]
MKINCFLDVLSGKFLLYFSLPFRIKKTVLRGMYKDGEFTVFLFNKDIKLKNKRGGKSVEDTHGSADEKKSVKKIDIIKIIRRLKFKNLYFDVLAGGGDYTEFLFINMFFANMIESFSKVIEEQFNIDDFDVNIFTSDKTCLKTAVNAYFDIFVYKIIRIFLSKKRIK